MPPSTRTLHSSTVISAARVVLGHIRNVLSSNTPPFLGPAIDIVISIFDAAETAKSLKRHCINIAEKSAQLVLSVHVELLQATTDISPTIYDNVGQLLRVLVDVQALAFSLSSKNIVQHFFQRYETQQRLAELTFRLDNCFQVFQIRSLLGVQNMLANLSGKQELSLDLLHQEINKLHQSISVISKERHTELLQRIGAVNSMITVYERRIHNEDESQRAILRNIRDQLEVVTNREDLSWIIKRREIDTASVFCDQDEIHGTILEGKYNGKKVLVQRFKKSSIQNFLDDVEAWHALWHPNIPQLIGYSEKSESHPFIVISGVLTKNVPMFVSNSITKGTVESFMTALQTMHGITSAIAYVRMNTTIRKYDLAECMKTSNISIGVERQPILGLQSILRKAKITEDLPEEDVNCEGYLGDQIWYLTNEIIFGDGEIYNIVYSSANANYATVDDLNQKKSRSHLREILKLTSWSADSSITSITRKINHLFTRLSDIQTIKGSLTFSDIRRCLLSLENHSQNRTFIPKNVWHGLNVGDMGYVKHDEGTESFVFLENVLQEAGFVAVHVDEFIVKCDPEQEIETESVGTRWIRHKFNRPSFVGLRKVSRSSISNSGGVMLHFLKMCSLYMAKYGKPNGLHLHDLMIVTENILAFRSGTFEYVDENIGGQPEQLYLYENIGGSAAPWAYWSLNSAPINEGDAIPNGMNDSRMITTIYQYPQKVSYIQLEDEDIGFSAVETCLYPQPSEKATISVIG